jgi:hypothetical protein
VVDFTYNYTDIGICEDAVFAVAKERGSLGKIRNGFKMLKDWTQCSVEHYG